MKTRLVVLFLILALAGMACDPSPENIEPPTPTGLVVCLSTSPLTLDPRNNTDASSFRVTQLVFSGLLRKGPNMTLIPDLAESWELVDDLTWKFKLRHGVLFHNGRELTADDVAYTFNSIMDEAFGSPKRGAFDNIDHIEVVDKYTVIFHTKEPFAPLLVNLTIGIVPAEEAEAAGQDFAQAPIGAGPFRFVDMSPEQEIRLVRFDDYFMGASKIENLTYRIVLDDTTRYLELIKGNLDFVQNGIAPDMVPVLENKDEFQVVTSAGTNYEYLAFNMQDPILSDLAVRKAIAHALNIPEMISSLFGGLARPATGLLPPASWAYEPNVAQYPYDPALSNQILDEAGYERGEDGYRFTLTYKTLLSDQAKLKAEIIQQMLKEIGIKVEIRGFDWATLFSDIKNGAFQMYSLQWVGVSEPDIYHYVFHSDSLPPNGANRGHYINPHLDELIIAGRTALTEEARRPIYQEIQRILSEDLPYVSLWYPDNVIIMKQGLTGFTPYPDGDLSNLWKIYWRSETE